MSKKRKLVAILKKINFFICYRFVFGFFKQPVLILAYHRILDLKTKDIFDHELISASLFDFEQQMQFISKTYNVITFNDLHKISKGLIKRPKRPLIISFDDGFTDNFKNAFPILEKYSLRGCFFVATDYIGTKNYFWFDRICILFNSSSFILVNEMVVEIVGPETKLINNKHACKIMLEHLKKINNKKRLEILEIIGNRLKLNPSNKTEELNLPMTWRQLDEMHTHGHEIASHSASHPILTRLSDDELQHEISSSKNILEKNLKITVNAIAYPSGNDYAFSEKIKIACEQVGYIFGVSYISGRNNYLGRDNFALKRLHIERYCNVDEFEAKLSIPKLFDQL